MARTGGLPETSPAAYHVLYHRPQDGWEPWPSIIYKSHKQAEKLSETDIAGASAWIDNYCLKMPLDGVDEATQWLIREILTN